MLGSNEIPYIPDEMDCRTCNMCASHCPTFQTTRLTEESPRGRLKIIRQLLSNETAISEKDASALRHCVECRACERVCPSKMQYADLLALAKAKLPKQKLPFSLGLLKRLISDPIKLIRFHKLLYVFQRTGLLSLIDKMGLLKFSKQEPINDLLSNIPKYEPLKEFYPSHGPKRGEVALFTGCIHQTMGQKTLQSTVSVLNHLGYDVHIPVDQQCCGLLHKKCGDELSADQFAVSNIRSLLNWKYDAVIFTATACGAHLVEYENPTFTAKLKEICQFLVESTWPEHIKLLPLDQRVAIHEPCSSRFPLQVQQSVYDLLTKIPKMGLVSLPDNNLCCGSGGSYSLTQAESSNKIRKSKITKIKETQCQLVASNNLGCALYLKEGLMEAKIVIKHPVEIIAQQLVNYNAPKLVVSDNR